MPWKKVRFKEKEVWAKVGADGALAVTGGRVEVRYSDKAGAKVYRGGASRVEPIEGAPLVELKDGTSADAAKGGRASRGSGFGKAGTRTAAQAAAAAGDARKRLAALPEGTAVCFTDGACHGNPGPAGAGAWLELPDGRTAAWSLSLGRATNNVGELTAIRMALELLDEGGWPEDGPAAVFTDSKYADGVLCRGWKARANRELILDVRARLGKRPNTRIEWVAGHVGIDGNEKADRLATSGAHGSSAKNWS
jgi:ribonuclease HI